MALPCIIDIKSCITPAPLVLVVMQVQVATSKGQKRTGEVFRFFSWPQVTLLFRDRGNKQSKQLH